MERWPHRLAHLVRRGLPAMLWDPSRSRFWCHATVWSTPMEHWAVTPAASIGRSSCSASKASCLRQARCDNQRIMTLTKRGETRAPASWGLTTRGGAPWEYAAAPESTDHIQIRREYGLFIDNEFKPSRPRKTFTVINPATEEPLARVAHASKADVDRAVRAARHAYEATWSRLPGSERAKYLYRIARILQERSREFAVVETMNSGKPIKESRDVDVPLAAAHFFYYAGWADKLEYAFPGRVPRSLGVAAQIIPWNFPLLMLAWKIAPALASGNTVVLKPASTTPLSALL